MYMFSFYRLKCLGYYRSRGLRAGESAECLYSYVLPTWEAVLELSTLPPPLPASQIPAPGKAKTLLEEMTFCRTVKKLISEKILDVDNGTKPK